MKKMILSLITVTSLVTTQALADGGGGSVGIGIGGGFSFGGGSHGSLKVSEFLCGIVGATTTGVIAKRAGATNPATFFGALIGGAIGVDFCRYLNSSVAQGLKQAVEAAMSDRMCGTTAWDGTDYYGHLTPLCESYRIDGNSGEKTGYNNTCKFFETSIYSKETRRLVAKPTAWACIDPVHGTWVVTKSNWVAPSKKPATCDTPAGRWDSGGGTIGIDAGPSNGSVDIYPGTVEIRTPRPVCSIDSGYTPWGLEKLRREVNDHGVKRGFRIAYNPPGRAFEHEVEIGMLKALSDDGRGVILYLSPELQKIVPASRVALECGVAPHFCRTKTVPLAYDSDMGPQRGRGRMEFLFRDGRIVVNGAPNLEIKIQYPNGYGICQ